MSQTVSLLSLVFILLSSNICGEISTIFTMQEAGLVLEKADDDTLVIFDVDRTLVQMGDQLLYSGKSGFKKKINTFPAYSRLSSEEQDTLLSIVLLKTSHEIIEFDAVELIHDLQKKNIKTLVCTTLETGEFGLIPSMEQWRIDTLAHLGLSFDAAFPQLEEIRFYPHEMSHSPLYKQGALIASKRTKGEIISLFLERLEWKPKKIVMIDDQMTDLKSVEDDLKKFGIEFQGLHYRYVEELLKGYAVSEELIAFQLNYLLDNKIWLTDSEAYMLLQESQEYKIIDTEEQVDSFFFNKRDVYEPVDGETIFVIARHGENESNVARTLDGRTLNLPLTFKGYQQGEKAGQKLSQKVTHIDHVIVNDMQRTRQTAEKMLEAFPESRPAYTNSANFLERFLGQYEGKTIKEYEPINLVEKALSKDASVSFEDKMRFTPNPDAPIEYRIESYATIWNRVLSGLQKNSLQHQGKIVLIVSHSGTLRSIYWHLAKQLGFFVPYENFKPDNGAYMIISAKNGKFSLLETNDVKIIPPTNP